MKRLLLINVFVIAVVWFAAAQQIDSLDNQPDEKISVNKEYDEDGNLIRYDSTYVFEWHGDSLIGFPKDKDFFSPPGFMGMEDVFKEFFNDSSMMMPFGNRFRMDRFDHPFDLFERFNKQFSDSTFHDHFSFDQNSTFYRFRNDSSLILQHPFRGFNYHDFSEFFDNFGFPEGFEEDFPWDSHHFFQDDKQQNEWEELMKKHQDEMKEFHKKWDRKNRSDADIELQKI